MRRRLVACLAVAMEVTVARQAHAAAVVRGVRYITTPNTSRLVVECSAPVHYRLQRIRARPEFGVPARVYVDFLDSQLSSDARAAVELPEGPLLRVRAGEPAVATSRLILDVPGLTEFGAFSMTDPFRLIIDVRGTPRAGPTKTMTRPDNATQGGPLLPESSPKLATAAVPRTNPPQARPPVPSRPAPQRFKIVLDPGHGGKDPGAIGIAGVAEKDVTLAIALRLKERLATRLNTDVVLTRETDVYLALEERTARANAEQADLFLSIHTNASPNPYLSGVETYYLNNTNDRATIRLAKMENGLTRVAGQGKRDVDTALILSDLIQSYKVQESVVLAEDIQRALVAALDVGGKPVSDLGVKRGPFFVLVGAGMPCVLAEVSFLTNPREGGRLAQSAYQDTIAEGLLRGIQRFVDNMHVAENL
ncbi:MAG: N-acetylmuramoyl-L-alanine amidase [Candidatus Binatia bacterium]